MYSNEKLQIKAWAEEDRPREKLLLKGRHNLSDAELLAILIASGSTEESAVELSRRMLASLDNDWNKLAKCSIKDLQTFRGIGEAKAITIMAALEIGRRRKESVTDIPTAIITSRDCYEQLRADFQDMDREKFMILLLNRANRLIRKLEISTGGVSGTVADPKLIFKSALEQLACGIVLAHNHPSGNLQPSKADVDLTRKIQQAGLLLEINVLDHLIVADEGYFSFADNGLL